VKSSVKLNISDGNHQREKSAMSIWLSSESDDTKCISHYPAIIVESKSDCILSHILFMSLERQ
jgi:hypothetical protein